MSKVMCFSAILAACVVGSPALTQEIERESRYGLYYAEVVNIIDGDNLVVSVDLWPGLVAEYSVRVRGIDAPEIRRPGCEDERNWAEEAKAQLLKLYDIGSTIKLENVENDSFAGRVLADVSRYRSDRWLDLKDEMIERNMAVAWTPKLADVPWCLLAKTR
jgi:micrococcal nuclease